MKNLKNYAIALVALVIAISSVTLMSFKKPTSLQSYWYVVVPDSNNPDEDLVTLTPATPTNSSSCSDENSGPRCAVELTQPLISPMTINEIEAHPDIEKTNNDKFSEED